MAAASTTPMMRQYHRIKASHPDAILFFRLGDFYEMFFEDAEVASEVLDITLTARGRGTDNEAPMCGVPYHSADGYLARLLEAGHKVAIAEQVEEASQAKGMVRREVVRVLTPGTLVEEDLLESRRANYLVAAIERGGRLGVAALDVSTGEFVTAEFDGPEARRRAVDEIGRWGPREICFPEGQEPRDWLVPGDPAKPGVEGVKTWSELPTWSFDTERAAARLQEHFGVATLDGFDLQGCEAAVAAAGALLYYVAEESHRGPVAHIRTLRRYRDRDALQLDAATRRSLEITESWQDGGRAGSLLAIVDRSVTAMGGRRIREWLLRPLRDVASIGQRADLVERLLASVRERDGVRETLRAVHDLERLTTRISLGRAGPRDLAALRTSLERVPEVKERLARLEAQLARELDGRLDPCPDLVERVSERLVDDPPAQIGAGGLIRDGFDPELDRLRTARREGKNFIAGLEAEEREKTGIGSLKVRFNKVFGYFIEVSKPNLDRVPERYVRKQTLTNAERFITPELKEFEDTVLGAEDRIAALEEKLFTDLRTWVARETARLRTTADALATLDALAAFAEAAARGGFVRPRVDDSRVLEVRGGRHPVVEALQPDVAFVPNDAYLDGGEHRIKLVTGPNMGGKSTYLRQLALIVILAQAGGFVPADGARIGVVDRIFTRVGASDNLARGASTFLVEMQETANILHHATSRSLVLLDEVGRGTSTYDGLSIAWAVLEYLHGDTEVAPRTLFATHYHELTGLAERLAGLGNLSVAVRESGEGVVFLHRVEPGAADRSYGIHVARLAGLPEPVVARAEEILTDLEGRATAEVRRPISPGDARRAREERAQLALFAAEEHPILQRLRETEPEKMTPLEALALLAAWRTELGVDSGDDGEGE